MIYATQLTKSRAIELDDNQRLTVWIGDSHHRGTDVWWDDRGDQWWIADLENQGLTYADNVALVRCNGDADEGLNQVTLACDLDGDGIWLVDVDSLKEFDAGYVDLLWRSDE